MAVLHYGNSEIEITDDVAKSLTRDPDFDLWEPGLHSLQLERGWVHFVTGPGIPIWIDQPTPSEPSVYVT